MRIIAWRAGMETAWQVSRAAHTASPSILTLRVSSVELATGVHLSIEGWADARVGQSLKINISLTIMKS